MTTNPLLSIQLEIPFDTISAEHIEPATIELVSRAKATLAQIGEVAGARTYDNTVKVLDESTSDLEVVMSIASHLESVVTSPEIRAAYNAVQPLVSAFYASIPLDASLWKALSDYAATDDAKALTGPRKRFVEKTMDEFRRHGAELDAAGKQKLEALSVELSDLTTKFSQNVVDATAAFELYVEDEARLAGLPERNKAAARAAAEARGKSGYRFGLDAPTYIAVMTYLEDAGIREALWRAFNTRATKGDHDNRPLIREILRLRREKAALLGYSNFADLVLADRMAKTGATARAFVEGLHAKTVMAFEREQKELLTFRRSIEGEGASPLSPWDIAFYAEKQRKALYAWDEEELRPYLEFESVVSGLFEVARRLYGIEVEKKDAPVWHESVACYSMRDRDGTDLGHFYADFFPRETKRDGAWMGPFITGASGGKHVATICGNLTPPTDTEPSLLTHREVETLFHEFGHLLHHMLTKVDVLSLAGTRVAWDFVELPSQIMENWCWEREGLDLFAKHYKTGERVPDALFQKMIRAKNFRSASDQMRQLGFASMDLAMHIDFDGSSDPVEYARSLFQPFSPAPLPDDYAMVASFGHLFASSVGYAAGYYSYKWAEVLDADAFARFREEGVFSPAVGARFRESVLAMGDSRDPLELFRDFRGRDPDPNALLERAGLLVSTPAE